MTDKTSRTKYWFPAYQQPQCSFLIETTAGYFDPLIVARNQPCVSFFCPRKETPEDDWCFKGA